MSRVSDARISYLAHSIIDGIRHDNLADFPNTPHALAEIKRVLGDFFGLEERLDTAARQKIQSLSRSVPPGSREWDVLYRKYIEEETKKQKL